MDRWTNKVAVVTGASCGIGAAIAVDLAKSGMIVVGLARRKERVDELIAKLPKSIKGSLHSFKCDVQQENEVVEAFSWIVSKFGGVDVLINNAGIVREAKLLGKDDTQAIRDTIATNIMGVVLCTREAYASMKTRGVDGHIVLINSIAGHKVPRAPGMPSLNIYAPTKHAVTAMTEVLRQELQSEGTKIKVTVSEVGEVLHKMRTTIYITYIYYFVYVL